MSQRSEARKLVEIVARERCPCGHLRQRHRKASGEIDGEVFGACRDCPCKGLIGWTEPEQGEER
jgi:hypothetical protein